MTTYEFRSAHDPITSRVKPQIVGEELERINARDGKVAAKTVVDEAEDKKSPLHPAFTWKNAVAAVKWRLHEARNLIKLVRIVAPDDNEEPSKPAWVYIPPETGTKNGHYQSVDRAVVLLDEWARGIEAATGKLNAAAKSLADLKRLAGEQKDDNAWRITLAMEAVKTAQKALELPS